jgi:hypothetical protein
MPSASGHANRDDEQRAKEILSEADAVDRAEDERFGERRGDELPERLTSAGGRRAWLEAAKQRLQERRAAEGKPVAGARAQRLREAKRRLEEELESECRANAASEAWRARGVMSNGRRLITPNKPDQPPQRPLGRVNVTDPDSRDGQGPQGLY